MYSTHTGCQSNPSQTLSNIYETAVNLATSSTLKPQSGVKKSTQGTPGELRSGTLARHSLSRSRGASRSGRNRSGGRWGATGVAKGDRRRPDGFNDVAIRGRQARIAVLEMPSFGVAIRGSRSRGFVQLLYFRRNRSRFLFALRRALVRTLSIFLKLFLFVLLYNCFPHPFSF